MDLSEVEKFETKVLKPSQAMRIGARIRPQCGGHYFFKGRSCAIGAWMEGLGVPYVHGAAVVDYPDLARELRVMSKDYFEKYKKTITEDNDSCMSREAIADRLEAIGY